MATSGVPKPEFQFLIFVYRITSSNPVMRLQMKTLYTADQFTPESRLYLTTSFLGVNRVARQMVLLLSGKRCSRL